MIIGALFAGLFVSPQTVALGGPPAKIFYAKSASSIYASIARRTAIGSVTPGTPLQMSGRARHGLRQFILDGWSQQGDDTTLFAAQGERTVLATLTGDAPNLKTLSTTTDDYGNVWNEVELMGFIRANQLVPDQDIVWTQAEALYSTRCSACHALHHTDEFTANQWPTILKTMTKNAALDPAQAALITQYLQSHAKQ